MNNSKYLPTGSTIADKYEVIDILGEDEFEILYLVRDLHRKGSFFVLKELFLETFSSRVNELVSTLPEAEGVFNKRKKQIIEEIEAQKLNLNAGDIKIYGYEEDYGTVYTIMEFSHNASLEKYLQYAPKGAKRLPSLDELVKRENKSTNSFFLVKIFLLLGVLLAIAFFAYQYFQRNSLEPSFEKLETSATMDTLKLKDRSKETTMETIIETTVKSTVETSPSESVSLEKEPIPDVPIVMKKEDNISIANEVNKTMEVMASASPMVGVNSPLPSVTRIPIVEAKSNTSIKLEENMTIVSDENLSVENDTNNTIVIETTIKNFLDAYISASSNASVEDTLTYYDDRLKRYFKSRNVSHKTIRKNQERYNKKWINRDFKISDFEILKSYQKDNINYYDVKTTTIWNVSNKRGKKVSGTSRGFMTLKEVGNSFKITSIYSLK